MNSMKPHVHAILQKAFPLIENPKTFTTGVQARDHMGNATTPFDPSAVCWCSIGAVNKVAGEMYGLMSEEAFDAIEFLHDQAKATGEAEGMGQFNDKVSRRKLLKFWRENLL